MTPEGKVKRKVSNLLKSTPGLYYFMPVQGGYGAATLDYLGWYMGHAFAIETKAPGKEPTPRQRETISAMQEAGAEVFIIDGDIAKLKGWLEYIKGLY